MPQEYDWLIKWKFTDGKEEEYQIHDLGAAMQGINTTVASFWTVLEEVTMKKVPAR